MQRRQRHAVQRSCMTQAVSLLWFVLVAVLFTGLQGEAVGTEADTSLALRTALDGQEEHVLITQHLDLTYLDTVVPTDGGPRYLTLLVVYSGTRSIQGRCVEPAPELPARKNPYREFKKQQCVLVVDSDAIRFTGTESSSVWVSNLYLRVAYISTDHRISTFMVHGEATVYLQDVTLQGDSSMSGADDQWDRGLTTYDNARVLVQDSTVADMSGPNATIAAVFHSSTVSFFACGFVNTVCTRRFNSTAAIMLAHAHSAVRAVASTFDEVTPQAIGNVYHAGEAYVDSAAQAKTYPGTTIKPADHAPAHLFASREDDELKAIKQEAVSVVVRSPRIEQPHSSPPPPPPPPPPSPPPPSPPPPSPPPPSSTKSSSNVVPQQYPAPVDQPAASQPARDSNSSRHALSSGQEAAIILGSMIVALVVGMGLGAGGYVMWKRQDSYLYHVEDPETANILLVDVEAQQLHGDGEK